MLPGTLPFRSLSSARCPAPERQELLQPSSLPPPATPPHPILEHHSRNQTSGSFRGDNQSAASLERTRLCGASLYNFKLTRLGACAVGSLIGKTNGWPGSQGGEPEQVEGGRSKMGGQEASHVGKRGLPALEICLLSANPSCWHLPRQPRGMSTTSDADPAHPPTRQGAGRNPEGQASCPGSQSTPRGVETGS